VLAAPGASGLEFQIKNDVMLFGEFENLIERRDALAGELTSKPGASVEAAQFEQREIMDFAVAIGGAVNRVVMNGDETGIAGKLQIGLDKSSAERHRATECSQRIFRRVS